MANVSFPCYDERLSEKIKVPYQFVSIRTLACLFQCAMITQFKYTKCGRTKTMTLIRSHFPQSMVKFAELGLFVLLLQGEANR